MRQAVNPPAQVLTDRQLDRVRACSESSRTLRLSGFSLSLTWPTPSRRHSRSSGKWVGTRMRDGTPALSELMRVGSQSIRFNQAIGYHVRHAESHRVVVSSARSGHARICVRSSACRPAIYSPVPPAVDYLRIHPGAAEILPISSRIRMSTSQGIFPIHHFTSARFPPSRSSITHRHGLDLGGIVIGVFEDRQAAEDLAGRQHCRPTARTMCSSPIRGAYA